VSVISTDESRERALESGAFSFLTKPIQSKEVLDEHLEQLKRFNARQQKNLLAVSAVPEQRDWFAQYLEADDVRVTTVDSFESACSVLTGSSYDCMVIDAGTAASEAMASRTPMMLDTPLECLPVLVYGPPNGGLHRELWSGLARSVVSREVRQPEHLLDEVSLFLHRDPAVMPETHRAALKGLHDGNQMLKGKKAMIVDDDMRNIFALSSLLEDLGMEVVSHDNGHDAVSSLQEQCEIDVILMDIMMPVMDGIDTIREIRRIDTCKDVPIIAVTAKAMKGDREKCMEAGAWDYLSKPVDTELMVSVLRAWLSC